MFAAVGAFHQNSYVVISKWDTLSPKSRFNSPEKREKIAEEMFSKNDRLTELKATFETPVKCVQMNCSRLKSTFRSTINNPHYRTTAIELYRFVNFPISVILMTQQNDEKVTNKHFVEKVLPYITPDEKVNMLELNIPGSVYDAIQQTCLKRDGLLREKALAQSGDEFSNVNNANDVWTTEASITICKPFSILVCNTLDNIILSRADICDPSKINDKLKKMIKSSTPTVLVSKWESLVSRVTKTLGKVFQARRSYSVGKATSPEYNYLDREVELSAVLNKFSDLSENEESETCAEVSSITSDEANSSKLTEGNVESSVADDRETAQEMAEFNLDEYDSLTVASGYAESEPQMGPSSSPVYFRESCADEDCTTFCSNQSYLDSFSELTSEWDVSQVTETDFSHVDSSGDETITHDSCKNSVEKAPLPWKQKDLSSPQIDYHINAVEFPKMTSTPKLNNKFSKAAYRDVNKAISAPEIQSNETTGPAGHVDELPTLLTDGHSTASLGTATNEEQVISIAYEDSAIKSFIR